MKRVFLGLASGLALVLVGCAPAAQSPTATTAPASTATTAPQPTATVAAPTSTVAPTSTAAGDAAPTATAGPKPTTTASGTPSASGTKMSNIQGFKLESFTIPTGTTVTWTNFDAAPHTSTSDTGVWDSKNLAQNATFSYTFATAGTYAYHCSLHPTMTGTITVQ